MLLPLSRKNGTRHGVAQRRRSLPRRSPADVGRSRVGDPEHGGRFTVKKYHSAKTVSEDAWQHDRIELLPLNPDYQPIPVAPHEGPEMVVVGEWVSSID